LPRWFFPKHCPNQRINGPPTPIGVCPIVLSDTVCLAPARHSYLRFRLAPIFKKRKRFILGLTKGNKDHDDQDREDKKQPGLHRPPGQHAGRESRAGLGGLPPESSAYLPLIPGSKIHSRRYDHERESQECEDRQEALDRPDELSRLHAEARPVGR
jgi:hypothetical protein